MTMSSMPTPPTPLYIMMSCGCRGIIEDTTAHHHLVLQCPVHRTGETYVVERALKIPLRYKLRLNPKQVFIWVGTQPKSMTEMFLKVAVCFGIGFTAFSVLYIIAHFALRG